jgi:hypothetical protein
MAADLSSLGLSFFVGHEPVRISAISKALNSEFRHASGLVIMGPLKSGQQN